MNATSPSVGPDEADRVADRDTDHDSALYLRGLIDAEELVRRARDRVAIPAGRVVTSHVPRF